MVETWQEILKLDNLLLASHINPDCDTLGSSIALYIVLKKMGKNVFLFNQTQSMPRRFHFLPHYDQISNKVVYKFDAVIACDCATFKRVGLDRDDKKIVNIDHHMTNVGYGDINLVNKSMSSTCMVIYNLFRANRVEITSEIATALYSGIVDDTGFFSYGNIDEKSFLNVADLISCGANISLVSHHLKQNMPLAKFRLHQHVMNSVDLLKNGRVAKVVIWQDDLQRTGAKREDAEDIANLILELASVDLSIMLIEEDSGEFKVSLRSKQGAVDVSKIALRFDGGGHYGAAGFLSTLVDSDLIIENILNEIKGW